MRQSYGEVLLEQERQQKKKRIKLLLILCLFILIIVAGTAAIVFLLNKDSIQTMIGNNEAELTTEATSELVDAEEEYLAEQLALAKKEGHLELLENMKKELIAGEAAVEVFRHMYEDELVLVSGGSYHFVPILDSIKKNTYKTENLSILENGEYQYVENGQVTSYKGIDVSKFQGRIDWNAVAADGVQFAFIRVGNRGYGGGTILDDDGFKRNIEGATKAGIKVGVYFYTQALNETELMEEVNYVLEKIAPYQVDCPVVYDVEIVAGEGGRMDALSAEERTHLTKLFCDSIQAAGYKPMIYLNLEMAALHLNLEELEAYDKWFAYYNPELYFPYDYTVWQYSENGKVAGIDGSVDMNISFKPIWE